MNGLNKMNEYKLEWMEHSQLLHEHVKISADNSASIRLEQSLALHDATRKTARAITAGVALAAIDGPLPVMDVVGFGVATTGAALAWYDYFTTS